MKNKNTLEEQDMNKLRVLSVLKALRKGYVKNLNQIKVMDQTKFKPQLIANSFYSLLRDAGWDYN